MASQKLYMAAFALIAIINALVVLICYADMDTLQEKIDADIEVLNTRYGYVETSAMLFASQISFAIVTLGLILNIAALVAFTIKDSRAFIVGLAAMGYCVIMALYFVRIEIAVICSAAVYELYNKRNESWE